MLSDANLKYVFAGLALFGLGAVAFTQYQEAEDATTERAIMAMGMAPQLPLIREISDEAGWHVSCEGMSGEMTTLRLSPDFWTDDETGESLVEDLFAVSSNTYAVWGREAEAESCDVRPAESSIEGPEEDVAIAFGLPAELAQYREIAQSCGLEETQIAAISDYYLDLIEPDAITEDWQALYIDLAQANRHGPTMCYMIMGNRYEEAFIEDRAAE